ncbi:YggS family pyridoxal phosphate-dependent enzyme [Nitratifractor sp.]|uniref:YggS family pyridoxal phosphate-dependent enzyme n=1 Tax=Nitratifractor sp. TaxID=2268144 RepID=UPI0025FFAD43|nr:YggS family pyridoxal phosphate-dependent enzyme [Nitratifractor sp.]
MDKILSTETLAHNLDAVIQRIEQARIRVDEHHIVKLVVVSKYTALQNVRTLYELGQRAFGENQVQQLSERIEATEDLPLEWHMIGRLQKNKINKLIDCNPFLFQSLDSLELAEALDKRLAVRERTMDCLLQINSAREASKAGVDPDDAVRIYREIAARYPRLKLRGVMTIGAHTEQMDSVRRSFETTRRIFDELQSDGATICSMGMSGDFELAIECGSTMVRIGSALFRER